MTRYAEGTTVSVESSRGEITGILAKHGVTTMAWGAGPGGDQLQFELNGRRYKFFIERPTARILWEVWKEEGKTERVLKYLPNESQVAAEWRRRWRAIVLLIKAKLEFSSGGDTTIEREFMPYLVMASGQTLGEWVESQDGQQQLLEAGT
jgi:hypothetical protein